MNRALGGDPFVAPRVGCTPQSLKDWIKKARSMAESRHCFNNRRLLEPIGYIPRAEAEQRYDTLPDTPVMAAQLKQNGLRHPGGSFGVVREKMDD